MPQSNIKPLTVIRPEQYATLGEAAELFRVDQRTIRRWVADGTLSAVRIGKRALRIDLASLKTSRVGAAVAA